MVGWYIHWVEASGTDETFHRPQLHPSSWYNGSRKLTNRTRLKIRNFQNRRKFITWKSLSFWLSQVRVIHRSNITGTHSGKCSIRPSSGVRYFTLVKSSASFHLITSHIIDLNLPHLITLTAYDQWLQDKHPFVFSWWPSQRMSHHPYLSQTLPLSTATDQHTRHDRLQLHSATASFRGDSPSWSGVHVLGEWCAWSKHGRVMLLRAVVYRHQSSWWTVHLCAAKAERLVCDRSDSRDGVAFGHVDRVRWEYAWNLKCRVVVGMFCTFHTYEKRGVRACCR